MSLAPFKNNKVRVTVNGTVISVAELTNIQLSKIGGVESKYGMRGTHSNRRHCVGKEKALFIIRRWYKTDIEQSLFYNLHVNGTDFDIEEYVTVPSSDSSEMGGIKITNCKSYKYKILNRNSNDIIGEEISGEGLAGSSVGSVPLPEPSEPEEPEPIYPPLYVASSTIIDDYKCRIFQYKGVPFDWGQITPIGWMEDVLNEPEILAMIRYNNKLYVAVSDWESDWETYNGYVYRYDGGTIWTLVSEDLDRVRSLIVWEGKLYAGTYRDTGGGVLRGKIRRYDGGTTWTTIIDEPAGWEGFGTIGYSEIFGFIHCLNVEAVVNRTEFGRINTTDFSFTYDNGNKHGNGTDRCRGMWSFAELPLGTRLWITCQRNQRTIYFETGYLFYSTDGINWTERSNYDYVSNVISHRGTLWHCCSYTDNYGLFKTRLLTFNEVYTWAKSWAIPEQCHNVMQLVKTGNQETDILYLSTFNKVYSHHGDTINDDSPIEIGSGFAAITALYYG